MTSDDLRIFAGVGADGKRIWHVDMGVVTACATTLACALEACRAACAVEVPASSD